MIVSWRYRVLAAMTCLVVDRLMNGSGLIFKLEPPTIARDDSPVCRLRKAVCSAERLEEQAVSRVKLGPLRS